MFKSTLAQLLTRAFCLSMALLFVLSIFLTGLVRALPQDDIDAINKDTVWHKTYPVCGGGTQATSGPSQPGPVFLIGDSIGTQVVGPLESAFTQQAGWSFSGDALASRTVSGGSVSPDGLGAVDKNASAIQNAKSVVIELGTNSGNFSPETVAQMINKIRGLAPSAVIYWVDTATVSKPELAQTLSGVNAIIYDQSTTLNYHVISWNKKVFGDAADPKNINSDAPNGGLISTADGYNVHLTEAGITAMTDLITSSVTGTSPGSTQAPGSTATSCCSSSATLLAGNTNPEKVWNYLVGTMNLSAIQAAAIMGNLEQESGFDPTITNSIGAHGIAQWYQGRREALQQFAAARGTDENDLATQLDFLKQELETSYKESTLDPLRAATDLATAVTIWLENFEKPCNKGACGGELAIRLPKATNWLNTFGSGTTGGASGAGGSCSTTGGAKDITYKDRAELVQRIKSNPEFKVSTKHGYPVESDIDTVWAAVTSGAPAGTQDAILKTLVIILEQYAQPNSQTIAIELFNRTQGACGDFFKGATGYGPYTSSHAYGLAMDIDTTGMDPHAVANLFKWIYDNKDVLSIGELEHDPVADGAQNIKFGGDYVYPDAVQADHKDHIHVGVKGTGATAPGCQAKPSGETV